MRVHVATCTLYDAWQVEAPPSLEVPGRSDGWLRRPSAVELTSPQISRRPSLSQVRAALQPVACCGATSCNEVQRRLSLQVSVVNRLSRSLTFSTTRRPSKVQAMQFFGRRRCTTLRRSVSHSVWRVLPHAVRCCMLQQRAAYCRTARQLQHSATCYDMRSSAMHCNML